MAKSKKQKRKEALVRLEVSNAKLLLAFEKTPRISVTTFDKNRINHVWHMRDLVRKDEMFNRGDGDGHPR